MIYKYRKGKFNRVSKEKGRKVNPSSLKQCYDTLRSMESFRRAFSGYFFSGVKFKPLNSSAVLTCNGNISIYTLNRRPCIGILVNGVNHPVFYNGKVSPVFMTSDQIGMIYSNVKKHDRNRFAISSFALSISDKKNKESIFENILNRRDELGIKNKPEVFELSKNKNISTLGRVEYAKSISTSYVGGRESVDYEKFYHIINDPSQVI